MLLFLKTNGSALPSWRAFFFVTTVSFGFLTSGCGYTLQGQGVYLPDDIRAIHVPLTRLQASDVRLQDNVTDALIAELTRYRELSVTSIQEADAVLETTIRSYQLRPDRVSPSGIVEEYQFTMVLNVVLKARSNNEVIFERPSYRFTQSYPAEGDLETQIEQQEEAWQEAAEDMAGELVSIIVEGF